MHDRSLLGPADVTDDALRRMVADLLHEHPDAVQLLSSVAEEVAYDLPALTTAGRYWVSGEARTPDGPTTFRIFVKHLQSFARSPLLAMAPPEVREMAAASVPWRTEALAYASDLGDRLPDGLAMPRALGVFDLDELSAAVWLEEVTHPPVVWDLERYRRAAYLAGRMAGSPEVAPLANVGAFDWSVRSFTSGHLEADVLPVLRGDEVWQHPAIADAFGPALRDRLLHAADRLGSWLDEADTFPLVTSHGDYSPNNLLPGASPASFTLIDFGFWLPNPVGFDLSQLLVGDVQLGRRPASLLEETDAAILPAYLEGLAAEGVAPDEAMVRRSHALLLMTFSGFSALPMEQLDTTPPDVLRPLAAERARLAEFCLDLVEATS